MLAAAASAMLARAAIATAEAWSAWWRFLARLATMRRWLCSAVGSAPDRDERLERPRGR